MIAEKSGYLSAAFAITLMFALLFKSLKGRPSVTSRPRSYSSSSSVPLTRSW